MMESGSSLLVRGSGGLFFFTGKQKQGASATKKSNSERTGAEHQSSGVSLFSRQEEKEQWNRYAMGSGSLEVTLLLEEMGKFVRIPFRVAVQANIICIYHDDDDVYDGESNGEQSLGSAAGGGGWLWRPFFLFKVKKLCCCCCWRTWPTPHKKSGLC